jgi:hypothetical protein
VYLDVREHEGNTGKTDNHAGRGGPEPRADTGSAGASAGFGACRRPVTQGWGICGCGCRSIYFARESRKDQRLADTWGRTADGKQIDIMVWGADGHVTCLDFVDHFSTGELPTPDSIGQPGE